MSYQNIFRLKLIGTENIKVPFCEKCNDFKTGKFCADCGSPLIEKETSLNSDEIIKQLRQESEEVDYALKEPCNGGNIEDEIQDFSTKYPNIIFQLDVTPDSGFGVGPERYYFKDGVKQDATPKINFEPPKF